jgi:hypothetical protein
VKVCPTYGPGYFYLPGSDTCVKITPRVTWDTLIANPVKRTSGSANFRTRAYIQADTRQNTEYGLLRTYVSLYGEFQRTTGAMKTLGNAADANSVQADAAFIQFGGLTAGRYDPLIGSGYGYGYAYAGAVKVRDPVTDGPTNGIMYTASLGNGVSLTVGLEDQTASRVTASSTAGYGVPDLIGKIKVDQSWGSVFLAGGTHEVRGSNANYTGSVGDTGYGYAVRGGAKINLPMLAAGDSVAFEAAYGSGFNAAVFNGYNAADANITVGAYKFSAPDAVGDRNDQMTKSWSVGGGFEHYWVPTVSTTLFGHYASIDQYGANNTVNIYSIGSKTAWSPVKGLVIGGEVYYSKLNRDAAIASTANNVTVDTTGGKKTDQWTGRLRVSRAF